MHYVPGSSWWNPIPYGLSRRSLHFTCKWFFSGWPGDWHKQLLESHIDTWPLMQMRNLVWVDSLARNNRFTRECELQKQREMQGWRGTLQCFSSLATSFFIHGISNEATCVADLSSLSHLLWQIGRVVHQQIRLICKNNTHHLLKPSVVLHIDSDFSLYQLQKVTDHPHLQMKTPKCRV